MAASSTPQVLPPIRVSPCTVGGPAFAMSLDMAGAQTLEELMAWKHAVDLDECIVRITARKVVALPDFTKQLRRASGAAPDNIAEGFGRYYPKEFHRYVVIARGELNEVLSQLYRGHRNGWLAKDEYEEGIARARQALKTSAGLQRYLRSCFETPKPPGTAKPPRRSST